MNDRERKLVEEVHRRTAAPSPSPQPPNEAPTIHYTQLPGHVDSPIAREWDTYRRAVGRLLAEGHENRWVLIKGEEIIGLWDTEHDARAAALGKFLMEPCLIQQIRTREPIVRMSSRFWGCQG